jgi:hypothetical protein
MDTNPILPALILVLLAWAAIATIAAVTLTSAKLIAHLWSAINPAPSGPVVDSHTLAPIFDLAVLGQAAAENCPGAATL